jgi:hypothetical protein
MLAHHFKIKDLDKLKYFLGLKIAHFPTDMFLNQHKYALDILTNNGHLGTPSYLIFLGTKAQA